MVFLLLILLAFLLLRIQDELTEPVTEPQVVSACPGCGREVDCEWMVCPHCLQRLLENCDGCQERKMISHPFCPACGCAATR